ncbi:MAG: tetratricopeptide repeat protein, partial [Parachlamydiaceae bacterium]
MTGWEIIGIDNQAGCIEKCQSFLPQHQFIQHDILQAAPALLTKTAAVVFVSHFYCSPAQAASFVQNLKDYQASDNSLVIFVNGCEGTDADELCHKLPFLRGKPSSQMSEEFQKALNQFGYNCISFVREAKVFFPPLTTEIEETLLTIQRSDYENPYLGIDENTKVFKGLMEFIASFPLEAMTTEQISAYLEALKNTFAKNHGNFLKICNKMVIAHPKKADAAFKAAFEQAQTEEASGYELELIDEKVAQGFFKEAKDMLGRRIQKTKENALFVHLGEICLQEGQYPEAAVVFWYAKRLGLQVDGKIEQVEKELLFKHHSQVGEYRGLGQANLDRKQLEAFRQKINEEYQLLATQPFGLEKAEGLRTIYSHVTQGIKAFVATLSEDVIQQLETWGHSLPCEYAIMGLGSLAREEMTPYSDLEFAILVASEEEGVKNYFRLFTYLLHLRVINLGETILPALDMSALNWLYDDLTPRGISFDGSMPTACKTPLGKQKGRLGDFELIHTPTKMSELQQIQENDPLKRLWVLKRYHLPTILSASTYIVGSPQGQTLVEEYQAQVRTFLSLGEGKKRALDLIEDDLSRFKPQLTEQENGKHYNVKKDLYRLPNTMFDGLANYFNLVSTSTWERIEELEKRNLLCPEGANNLKLLTMGAQELRLATYLKHDRQKEHLDLDEHKENLHKIYYISLAFTKVMEQFCNLLKENQNPENLLSTSTFKDKSAYHSGLIHMRHLDYLLAEQAFEEDVSEQEYYKIRADLKVILGKYTQAIESYQKALALSETPELWKKLGKAYQNQALYPQAEEAFLQGLACIHASYQRYLKEEVLLEANTFDGWSKIARCYIQERKLYLTTPLAKPSVAKIDQVFLEFEKIYLALAELYKITAHYSQARAALNMCKKLAYERTKMLEKDPEYQVIVDLDLAELYKVEASIAKDLDSQFEKGENLIQQAKHILIAYYKREDHPKVFECEMLLNLPLGKSLEILQLMQKLFGDGHPNLATIYHSIGFVLHHQGKYEEALQNYTQALEMRKKLFGEDHLDVAASYNDIGLVLHHQGKYKEASQHYAQALKIGEKLLGEKHPHVATSYCNIGSVLHHQGKYEEALQHYTQALEMGKKLLGEEHPAVTTTYGNIGLVLHHQGKYEEASQHYTQALEMEKKLLGEEHVALATTYSNIGSVLNAQGKYEEALRHHTQALEIR